jgi:4-diphosphocytidyl-2-C-methyl-D-erythritol kinase
VTLNARKPTETVRLVEAAFAKINLALHVRRRRADGYHDLETIFAFTEFGDTLTGAVAETRTGAESDGLTLAVDGEFAMAVGAADDLVLRAARALAAAAGALRLLNRLWQLDWPLARLAEVGGRLGADVPACVFGTTQLGRGRGEQLLPYPGGIVAGTAVLLVNPGVPMPTGPVFAGWDEVDRGSLDPALPLAALRNDLTGPATALDPVLGTVLSVLGDTGAKLVRMSGSGATCLGLFGAQTACAAARDRIASAFPGWWTVATTLR